MYKRNFSDDYNLEKIIKLNMNIIIAYIYPYV